MTATAPAFAEACVEVDGFRIRYLDSGTGVPGDRAGSTWLRPFGGQRSDAVVSRTCGHPGQRTDLVGDFLERREAFIVNAKISLLNP